MTARHEYRLQLSDHRPNSPPLRPASMTFRNPSTSDVDVLAELMLDAYRGTIDDDGETLKDAISKIQSYFENAEVPPLLEHSWLLFDGATLVSACLLAWWEKRQAPIVAYVMTRGAWKGEGVGMVLVQKALGSLAQAQCHEVRAVITEGNLPSEALFRRLGFSRVGP